MEIKESVKCLDGFVDLFIENSFTSFYHKLNKINRYWTGDDDFFVRFLRRINSFDEIVNKMMKNKKVKSMGYGYDWPFMYQPGGNPRLKEAKEYESDGRLWVRPIDVKPTADSLGLYYNGGFGEATIHLSAIRIDKMPMSQALTTNQGKPFFNEGNREIVSYFKANNLFYRFHLQIIID